MEEIDVGIILLLDFIFVKFLLFGFNFEEELGGFVVVLIIFWFFYFNEFYGVEDKFEEEVVVMEVKEFKNMEDVREVEDIINVFDDILNGFFVNELIDELEII